MAEAFHDEGAEFLPDDIEPIIRAAIHNSIHEQAYNVKKVNEWTNAIVTSCLKELQALARPFKYVITCTIMQKTGAALLCSASMHWDVMKDGNCKVSWENPTMHCIVTIYGVSVNIDDPHDLDM
jgi:dynein light chain Tctex-type 1